MKRQNKFNRDMDEYLSLSKPGLKKKTLWFEIKETWDYLMQKEVPTNINDIKDNTNVLIIQREETFWEKLMNIFPFSYIKEKLKERKKKDEF